MGLKDAAGSFVAGLLITLILVVVVPVLVEGYIEGLLEDIVGDTGWAFLTSDVIVTILLWAVILGLMMLLGAGSILKRFGVVGLIGLVAAYWLLGDVTDAIVPLIVLAIMLVITWCRDRKGSGSKG